MVSVSLYSGIIGGNFTVLSDLIGRIILSPREIPVGVVTSFLGGPIFIYIYFYKKNYSQKECFANSFALETAKNKKIFKNG